MFTVPRIPPPRSRQPGGFTLVEALVSLLLLVFVLQAGWGLLARFRSGAGSVAHRAEALETVRTVAWILSEEISSGDRDRGWWAGAGDSVALRVFRGFALVEGVLPPGDILLVCYRGIRSPEPEKDSVLILGRDGAWNAYRLTSRRVIGPECAGPGKAFLVAAREEAWTLSAPPPEPGGVARIFERGSYHLADRALRYRRGLGGRQPLTPERILRGRFLPDAGGGGRLRWDALLTVPGEDSALYLWGGRIR